MKNGLTSLDKQREIVAAFNEKILSYLDLFTGYITADAAAKINNYSRQGATKGLERLAKTRLIKEHQVLTFGGRKIRVWGITALGHKSATTGGSDKQPRSWSAHKFRANTMEHEMAIICLADKINQNHTLYRPQLIGGYKQEKGPPKGGRRPDFLFNDDGTIIAAEVEITQKSNRRYAEYLEIYSRNKCPSNWYAPEQVSVALDESFDQIYQDEKYTHLEPQKARVYRLDLDTFEAIETEESKARNSSPTLYDKEQAEIERENIEREKQFAAAEKQRAINAEEREKKQEQETAEREATQLCEAQRNKRVLNAKWAIIAATIASLVGYFSLFYDWNSGTDLLQGIGMLVFCVVIVSVIYTSIDKQKGKGPYS